jgi:hypothetical protein
LISLDKSQSWSRSTVETKSRNLNLNCQDQLFESVQIFPTVEIESLDWDTIDTNRDPQA